eukprot:TRINITY_DN22758_c0_g1_i1.p1 TRINITY_DN22758_c0_g1~~TRINITY_DN22758_c0_g1_i1.p1  ORF type:complete len:259 (+),score=53.25 TRINITY_DN22758_c0_g1_i1:119-895(+)
MSEKKAKIAKEVFAKYDIDKNGTISQEELVRVLTKLNPSMTRPDIEMMFESIDADRNGTIEYSEFVDWLTGASSEYKIQRTSILLDRDGSARDRAADMSGQKRQQLRTKLAYLDKDGNGSLDFLEISSFLQQRYPNMSIPDLRFLFDCADKSKDGNLDFYELLDLIMTVPKQKADPNATQKPAKTPYEAAIYRDDVKQQFEEAFEKEEKDHKELMGKVSELVSSLQDVRDEDKRFQLWRDEHAKLMRERYAETGLLRN